MRNTVYTLITLLFLTISAQASQSYHCTSSGGISFDELIFTEINLTIDGIHLSGEVLTDLGWMKINDFSQTTSISGKIVPGPSPEIQLEYRRWYNTAYMDLSIRDGLTMAKIQESIDCVDDDHFFDLAVQCVPLTQ